MLRLLYGNPFLKPTDKLYGYMDLWVWGLVLYGLQGMEGCRMDFRTSGQEGEALCSRSR